MRLRMGLLAAVALTLSCAHVGAFDGDEETAVEDRTAAADAPAFAIRAASMNANAIELSRLAEGRAFDSQARHYALTELTDHVRLSGELRRLAKERGWDLPDVADPEHRALEDQLQHVSGPDVDVLYVNGMIHDHVDAVSQFQRYVRTGDDPDLVAWARRTLTTLQKHQDLAETTSDWVQPAMR